MHREGDVSFGRLMDVRSVAQEPTVAISNHRAASGLNARPVNSQDEILRSPGEALETRTASYMESRFGHDFGKVRVHADPKAAKSARALNALAYTVGSDIVFGAGMYAPETEGGRKLLAHELAHTIQQTAERRETSTKPARTGRLSLEQEADAAMEGSSKVITPVGRTFAGPQLYEAGEHAQFGEAAQEFTINGVKMSYGEIIAMGDFFESPDDMQKAATSELQAIVDLIRKDVPAPGSVKTEEWQKATGGRYTKLAEKNAAHFSPSNPAILASAGTSTENNKSRWEELHAKAIVKAQQGKKDEALETNAFADHFLTDAFASGHMINKPDVMAKAKAELVKGGTKFFDDVANAVWADKPTADFVSTFETVEFKGVIFRPNINSAGRFSKLLQGINDKEPDVLANSIVRVVHDVLNVAGVDVTNPRGDKWTVQGDAHLNAKSLEIGKMAVAQSRQNIVQVLNTPDVVSGGGVPPAPDVPALQKRVWDYVPTPTVKGVADIKTQVTTYTDPTQKATVDAVATLIKINIHAIIDELVARKILKKA
jgi:hypothetical protein